MKEMEVRFERLSTMRAAYVHSFSATHEEDAAKKILEWAGAKGLAEKSGVRLFGRNTYPTDKPEPHGYEFHLTIDATTETGADVETSDIPGGLYVVLMFKNLSNIGEAWKKLWTWIETSKYEHTAWQKGNHGWVGGFEEQVNWQEQKPPSEWVFDLWVQLKEPSKKT